MTAVVDAEPSLAIGPSPAAPARRRQGVLASGWSRGGGLVLAASVRIRMTGRHHGTPPAATEA